jgi:2-octaprenyl-6-methoxyphenol hydroxylase
MEGALQAAPACDLFWAATIEGIETGPGRVALHFRLEEIARSVSGAVLIGADGINSAVRRYAHIDADTRDYGQTAVVSNLAAAGRCPATAFERFTRDGPIAFLPLSDSRWASVRVFPTGEIERVLNLSDDEYLRDLAVRFGHRLGVFSELGKRHVHPLALSRARSLTADRCALVGGAANSIHPNAAQGLNLGLRDVATLAECIADAKHASDDIGGRSCLERYAEGRVRDHARVVAFTDLLAQGFASNLASISFTRNAAMLAIDLIPALKRRLIRSAMGLTGPQPRLVREGRSG